MATFFAPKARSIARLAFAVAALALVVLVGWWALHRAPRVESLAKAAPAPKSAGFQLTPEQWASLTVEAVGESSFDSVVTVDGALAANDNATVSVYSPFSGRVTAVYAQPGQAVHKGAPLLAMLATESAQSKSDLAAAIAAEANAGKQLELARSSEARQHALFLAEAAAEKDWEQSKADLAAAQNTFEATKAALAAAQEKSAVLAAGSPDRSGQAVVTAPIDGVVLQRQVASGQLVNSLATGGSTALYTISDLHSVWVVATVSELDAARIKLGQPIEVTSIALPGLVMRSHVSWISATVDPATHRVAMRAELPSPDQSLRPQLSATVRVLQTQASRAIAVPRSALVYDGDQVHCYVASENHLLVARSLKIGRVQGNLAEVNSGLSAGERVITRGALFVDRAADGAAS